MYGKALPYVELIEVDKVEAKCSGISKWIALLKEQMQSYPLLWKDIGDL